MDLPTKQAIKILQALIHSQAAEAGWWADLETGRNLAQGIDPLLVATKLALVHSEISEALEGYRTNQHDDKLPQYPAITVELADAIIRIFDLAGAMHLDIAGALVDKLAYNKNRADHKPEARKSKNGKRF